ncbi:MAG: sodium:solute symporter family protein [Bacteroidota bacterium]
MNPLDLTVLLTYFLGITAFGLWISRKTDSSEGYFMGGRKLRWWTLMGQSFGAGTHAEMPVAQAGASFSGGFATIWYQWKNMLITPFYWLLAPWYRRSGRTTIAEMVADRYGRRMGLFYTIFAIVFFVFVMGVMLQGAAKVIAIASGEVISSNMVVIGMALAFMIYSFFGGLTAAAHTEFVQAILIIVLSFLLIPLGLTEVGGFAEMRRVLPEDFFLLFSEDSGLGMFTILMLALNGVVGITAQPHMMSMIATGNSEIAGRIGHTYGNFVKRLVTIGWALTGLVVAALVIKTGAKLEDPEHAFGYASRVLLGPGLTGLMIACVLAANMSSCSNFMVNLGALFAKDLYLPYLNPSAHDQQLLRVGRISGVVLTSLAILFALFVKNVLSAFLFVETIAAFMGIMIVGGMLWKRANRYGAFVAVLAAYLSYYLLNYLTVGEWNLIYRWKPEPFGWAMLIGGASLILVSMLTKKESADRINQFFSKMERLADADQAEGVDSLATAHGKGLILLDLPSWLSRKRWQNFAKAYREDWLGFLLAWGMVLFLIGLAWAILQIG